RLRDVPADFIPGRAGEETIAVPRQDPFGAAAGIFERGVPSATVVHDIVVLVPVQRAEETVPGGVVEGVEALPGQKVGFWKDVEVEADAGVVLCLERDSKMLEAGRPQ